MGIFSLISHYKSHGSSVYTLTRRKPVPITQPSNINDDDTNTNGTNQSNNATEDIEDTLSPTVLIQQP